MEENIIYLLLGGALPLIGVIVNNVFSQRAATKERNYLESKELYLHVIETLAAAAVGKENTTKDWTVVELWAEIVAPVEVQNCLKEIVDTNNGHPGRKAAVNKMCAAMKKDLK